MQMLDKSAAESIAKALKLNKNMQKRLVAPVCRKLILAEDEGLVRYHQLVKRL